MGKGYMGHFCTIFETPWDHNHFKMKAKKAQSRESEGQTEELFQMEGNRQDMAAGYNVRPWTKSFCCKGRCWDDWRNLKGVSV